MPETPKTPERPKPTYAELDLVRAHNIEQPLVVLGTDFYPDDDGFIETVWLWTDVHKSIPEDLDLQKIKDAFEDDEKGLPEHVRFLPAEFLTKIDHA